MQFIPQATLQSPSNIPNQGKATAIKEKYWKRNSSVQAINRRKSKRKWEKLSYWLYPCSSSSHTACGRGGSFCGVGMIFSESTLNVKGASCGGEMGVVKIMIRMRVAKVVLVTGCMGLGIVRPKHPSLIINHTIRHRMESISTNSFLFQHSSSTPEHICWYGLLRAQKDADDCDVNAEQKRRDNGWARVAISVNNPLH